VVQLALAVVGGPETVVPVEMLPVLMILVPVAREVWVELWVVRAWAGHLAFELIKS
jgi:hypothetical protein